MIPRGTRRLKGFLVPGTAGRGSARQAMGFPPVRHLKNYLLLL
jgi:hypothetical protein